MYWKNGDKIDNKIIFFDMNSVFDCVYCIFS